jgi:hypothetical protein
MKFLLVVGGGVIASFGLTILAEFVWFNSANSGFWHLYPEFILIPVIIGATIGIAAKKKAAAAAAWALAPWSAWLVMGASFRHAPILHLATTVGVVLTCFGFGVGTAALVGRRMRTSEPASTQRMPQTAR